MWRVFEPCHALVYFSEHKKRHYDAVGLKGGWMGYFASRAAAMGPVPAEVVVATFYNFSPAMVRRAIPDAWRYSSPSRVLEARFATVDETTRDLWSDSQATAACAHLARQAVAACTFEGRPLAAAHAGLEPPDDDRLRLWHALTILREHRGDGHVAALLTHQIDGCEANVLITAEGTMPAGSQRQFRGWSAEEWESARDRLRGRGLLGSDDALTPAGRETRTSIEALTDELALAPWRAMGDEGCRDLRDLLLPLARAVIESGGVAYPNPMGLTPIDERSKV